MNKITKTNIISLCLFLFLVTLFVLIVVNIKNAESSVKPEAYNCYTIRYETDGAVFGKNLSTRCWLYCKLDQQNYFTIPVKCEDSEKESLTVRAKRSVKLIVEE